MKRTIYVVDDQKAVLQTVTFVLRTLGSGWEVSDFTDPAAALAAVKAQPPDAIVSDQMMPGLQGSELLEQVRAVSPRTIRVIMSGFVSLNKLELITSAHQYLAKPFDAFQLRDIMRRSFAAQERMDNQHLQSVVTAIRSIPSLPQVHHSLLAELKDSRNPCQTIAGLITTDPGLATKVLQLANSPLFGQGARVANVEDAVNRLGTDLIEAIILSQNIFSHYESLKGRDIDLPRVWAHCWETAKLAQRLCREKELRGKISEDAFLAGLLHEVGRFILIDNFPAEYQSACEAARQSNTPLAPHLKEVFRAAPLQISAYILELWGLPPAVVDCIASMDKPEANEASSFCLVSALYVANRIASQKFPADPYGLEEWNTGYLRAIGCEQEIPAWEKLAADSAGSH